jgi:pimeloyl-ACP methyl ester carboxylesterase
MGRKRPDRATGGNRTSLLPHEALREPGFRPLAIGTGFEQLRVSGTEWPFGYGTRNGRRSAARRPIPSSGAGPRFGDVACKHAGGARQATVWERPSIASSPMSRQLMVPAADTRLYSVDEPGGAPALLFLSGGFGTVRNWSHVMDRLGGKYRTVRFDARARGKSGRSADYSAQGAVDDVGRVIEATGLERPILVGWSYGATIAVRYSARHPGQVGGLVLVDGAYPIAVFDEAGKEKVRAQFRRLGWLMRIAAALGRSARMSPAEAADVVIEMDAVNGELEADFSALDCPTVFVVGTGAHSGATEDEMRTVRAAVATAVESNERVSVFATTPHKHTQILGKAPETVVDAIEDVIHES